MPDSTCRSCGAPIKWIKTKAGKFIPCDDEPLKWEDLKSGDRVVGETGEVVQHDGSQRNTHQRFYFSHFATCPDADKFRRSNK